MPKWSNLKRDMYRTEPVLGRPDLQIRNLLDDPALRRAMSLDLLHADVTGAATRVSVKRRQRRFDRRMSLIRPDSSYRPFGRLNASPKMRGTGSGRGA